MNKKILSSIIVALAVTTGLVGVYVDGFNLSSTYEYIPSDISNANPNLNPPSGSASMSTIHPFDVRDQITNTVIGTVLSVGDPIEWDAGRNSIQGFVPVTLKVHKNIKGELGETVTFYLHGSYSSNEFMLMPYAGQYEIGEKVLVHLEPDPNFTFLDGEGLYTTLGKYGKYHIGEDSRAYNEKYPQGRNLVFAENESR